MSLRTLGIEKIDVYYLHNPEQQRERSSPEAFRQIMRSAFEVLERAVEQGLIGVYGIATWTGARADAGFSISCLKALAVEVAADTCSVADHFSYVQAPLSINMRDALVPRHASCNGPVSLVRLCELSGLKFVASAAAGGGRVSAIAATSVSWVRSVPGVDTALVGTLTPGHLKALAP
jgi:aryl-alcohol dehydrogenase-like predicted oxidoreductase